MTMLDWLHMIGSSAWQPIWVPILSWTAICLPVWLGLEWMESLHPHTEYRFRQVLLGTLPLGIVLTSLVGPLLSPPGLGVVPPPTVSVSAIDVGPSDHPVDPSWTWMQIVGVLTVIGALLGTIRLCTVIFNVRSVRQLRGSFPSSGASSVQHQVDEVSSDLGVARPVVAHFSSRVTVPVTLGGTRPRILLPSHLADSPDALAMTLRHECVHIRRYDDLCQLVEHVIEAVFFFHPLVHGLQRSIESVRERACDAAVLDDARTSASEYAQLLLTFADTSPRPNGALSLSESPSSLKRRLLAMKSPLPRRLQSSHARATSLVAVCITLTLGIVGCSEGLSPTDTADTSVRDESAAPLASAKDLDSRPSIKGGMNALMDHIEYPSLAKDAGIEGRVLVQFVVTTNGNGTQVRVKKSVHPTLDSAAVKAVRTVSFVPGTKDGEPVATRMTLPVSFQLPSQQSSGSSASKENQTTSMSARRSPEIVGGPDALMDAVSYPELARKAGIEGTVVVVAHLDPDGHVEDAHIKNGVHEALDAAALQAVRSVRFASSSNAQGLARTEVTVPITFSLPDDADA